MLKDEWLAIGYEKGLIDDVSENEWVSFSDVYKAWFMMKMNRIKPQSVDRIEVTYNKYYYGSRLADMPVHTIDESKIIAFLNDTIVRCGNITEKEYARIYQIVNNVMQYGFDTKRGHCYCVNWNSVKQYIALDNIVTVKKKEMWVGSDDRNTLASAVLDYNIYNEKRSATLLLLANFYLGMRIGELASLRWSDVNWHERYIYTHTTQTKYYQRDEFGNRVGPMRYVNQDTTKTPHSVRAVPLCDNALYLLRQLYEWHKTKGYQSEFLAYDGTDTILSRSLARTLTRLCKLCEVNTFNSHRIRKTYSSELHRIGVPLRMISDVMGHADIRTTEENYLISYDDTLQVIRKALENGSMMNLRKGAKHG